MFSGAMAYFGGKPVEEKKALPQPLARIDKVPEFKSVLEKIAEIKRQDEKLSGEAKNAGAHGKEYDKHTTLEDLLIRLKTKIAEFNESVPASADRKEELRDMIRLALKLSFIATTVRNEAKDTLNAQRPTWSKKIVDKAVDVGVVGASFGVAFLVSASTLGAGGATLLAAPRMSGAAKNAMGLSERNAYSYSLVCEMVDTLDGLANNLSRELNRVLKRSAEPYKFPEALNGSICPLTQRIMRNPVYCILDCITYEESEIRTSLAKFGKSPVTQKELGPSQTIDGVLFKAINVKNMIEDYLQKNPELVYECSPSPVSESEAEAKLTAKM